MKDTIYREDAIKAINARANWYQVTCNGKQIAVMLMAKDVNEMILEKVPSADRPQGEWIGEADGYADGEFVYDTWYCSNCDYAVDDDEPPTWNFCPNCGARMKGADDE